MPSSNQAINPLVAALILLLSALRQRQAVHQICSPFATACEVCGLDFKAVETGDGPAVFAIFILGFLCLGGALIAEFKFGVPWWMHVLLWGILTPLVAIFLLRFLKALLIALQYKHKVEEGRIAKE